MTDTTARTAGTKNPPIAAATARGAESNQSANRKDVPLMVQNTTHTIPTEITQAVAAFRQEPIEDAVAGILSGALDVAARLASGEIILDLDRVVEVTSTGEGVLVGRWASKRGWLTIGEQKFVRADLPKDAPTWATDVTSDVFHDGTFVRSYTRTLARADEVGYAVCLDRTVSVDGVFEPEEQATAFIGSVGVEFRDTASMRIAAALLLAAADRWDEVAEKAVS